MVRDGLQMRLSMKIRGRHPVMIWRLEHACDLLSNCQVTGDGKTGHRIPKGNKYSGDEREGPPLAQKETSTRKVRVQAAEENVHWQHVAHRRRDIWHQDCHSQVWNETQTPSTSTLGYKKGWKVFEENLGTRSSSKRFEDQVAVGGGKWQGHKGDDAEIAMLIDIVCHDRISRTTDARRVVKGAKCCLQEPLREVTGNTAVPG